MTDEVEDYLGYLKVCMRDQISFNHYGSSVRIINVSSSGDAFGVVRYVFGLSCGSTICITRENKK